VGKAFPPITLKGVEYHVLRLDRQAFGPRFLLQHAAGRLYGLFERGADASHFDALPRGVLHPRRRRPGRR
jgi:hypothetical protein